MMNSLGYQRYKAQAVNTMTQGEMLILLYDELLKRLMRAELALEKKDYDLFDTSVTRCKDIVYYLRDTLNMSYDISRQLYRMYDFFSYQLGRIAVSRNPKQIEELKPLVSELRDAYKQAARVQE